MSLQTVPVRQQLVRARTYKVCKVKQCWRSVENRPSAEFCTVTREGIIIPSFTLQVISNLDNSNRTLNITKKNHKNKETLAVIEHSLKFQKKKSELTIICWWRFMRYMSQISDRREVSSSRISEYLINWIFRSVLGSLTTNSSAVSQYRWYYIYHWAISFL